MNLFRRLEAPPNPLHETYTAATGRTVQDAVGDNSSTGTPADWIAAPDYPEIWAALAAVGANPGVLSPDTPGLPAPATTEGEPR